MKNKLTDNEIIKVWEKVLATGDAPFGEHWLCSITTGLAKETFDMLNHQKAEIERLNKEATEQQLRKEMHRLTVDEVKIEAVKEFVKGFRDVSFDKIRDIIWDMCGDLGDDSIKLVTFNRIWTYITDILEELTEQRRGD